MKLSRCLFPMMTGTGWEAEMSDLIIPFYGGEQWGDWQERNCVNCAKGDAFSPFPACPIADAIMDVAAGIDDGLTPEMARRMNYTDGAYSWQCGEFEAKK